MKIQDSRISQISTQWTEILKANQPADSKTSDGNSVQTAQQTVLNRYGSCIYRYLLGATRDPSVAEELAQEFAFRFVRGDLKNVSPERGRFRDYLKTVLRNIANDFFRSKRREMDNQHSVDNNASIAFDPFEQIDQEFKESWRQQLLAEAWRQLKEFEYHRSNLYYTVLRHRADFPERDSYQMAEILSKQLSQDCSGEWVRQNLKRARKKFRSFLIGEVKKTLFADATEEEVEAELAELRLLKYTN